MPKLAYLNGQLIPAERLTVPVEDTGFVQGVTVAEQMRTFGGKLFRLEEHLQRLRNSLDVVGIRGVDVEALADAARALAAHNHQLLASGDDLGLSLFVTPGIYATFAPSREQRPTIGMHTYPIPFQQWADKYVCGQKLVVSSIRQVPDSCWPTSLKCRSRMHYYLADQEAAARERGSRALLLDQEGFVTEASTANIVVYLRNDGFLSPPENKILPGVSVAVLQELAARLGERFSHRELTTNDIHDADEVILSSTSPCLLPAVSLDGRAIGAGKVGPVFQKTLDAWSDLVGLDIIEQARKFAGRSC